MNWSDIQNLDFENVGGWPTPIKAIAIALLFLFILGAGWYFDINDQREQLLAVEATEQELRKTFEFKQKKVSNLAALRQQLEDIKQTFGDLLKRLPDETEVASLLVDISQQGLAAGLEFELFKPGREKPEEFYAELPIQIRVTGDYHELGQFVSGVADLPRIVTQHNVTIRKKGKNGTLVMDTVAKTYRYLDEEGEG